MKGEPGVENRKVRYTKAVIRQSLIELLHSRPIEDIKVTDLCRLADINRSTFYSYYTDIYDLMQKSENALYEELFQSLQTGAKDTQYTIVLRALRSVEKNKELYKILFTEREDKAFIARLIVPAYEMMDREYAPQRKFDENVKQLEYNFITDGITGIWRTWIDSGCALPPERVARLIDKMIESFSSCILSMDLV